MLMLMMMNWPMMENDLQKVVDFGVVMVVTLCHFPMYLLHLMTIVASAVEIVQSDSLQLHSANLSDAPLNFDVLALHQEAVSFSAFLIVRSAIHSHVWPQSAAVLSLLLLVVSRRVRLKIEKFKEQLNLMVNSLPMHSEKRALPFRRNKSLPLLLLLAFGAAVICTPKSVIN